MPKGHKALNKRPAGQSKERRADDADLFFVDKGPTRKRAIVKARRRAEKAQAAAPLTKTEAARSRVLGVDAALQLAGPTVVKLPKRKQSTPTPSEETLLARNRAQLERAKKVSHVSTACRRLTRRLCR